MMKILGVLHRNMALILVVLLIGMFSMLIMRADSLGTKLENAEKKLVELKEAAKNVDDGVRELSKSGKEGVARTARVEREIRYVQAIPDETECPHSVHVAVDFLRDRAEADDPR
jgi:hypothetical protein